MIKSYDTYVNTIASSAIYTVLARDIKDPKKRTAVIELANSEYTRTTFFTNYMRSVYKIELTRSDTQNLITKYQMAGKGDENFVPPQLWEHVTGRHIDAYLAQKSRKPSNK
jgi:CRISPR/Cas system-associated endoribonuclease Cas2